MGWDEFQLETARRFDASALPVDRETVVGLSDNVRSGEWPVNGLRHSPERDESGWYVWSGEHLSDASDFFKPVHASHLAEICPPVIPYLGLPPGWRFLIAPGYEDVWYDADLLDPPA